MIKIYQAYDNGNFNDAINPGWKDLADQCWNNRPEDAICQRTFPFLSLDEGDYSYELAFIDEAFEVDGAPLVGPTDTVIYVSYDDWGSTLSNTLRAAEVLPTSTPTTRWYSGTAAASCTGFSSNSAGVQYRYGNTAASAFPGWHNTAVDNCNIQSGKFVCGCVDVAAKSKAPTVSPTEKSEFPK